MPPARIIHWSSGWLVLTIESAPLSELDWLHIICGGLVVLVCLNTLIQPGAGVSAVWLALPNTVNTSPSDAESEQTMVLIELGWIVRSAA